MGAPFPSSPKPAARLTAIGIAALAACSVSGCGVDYASSAPVLATDYHERHAIALVNAPTSLDIYPNGGKLDARSTAGIRAFADSYKRRGSGEILIMTPPGAASGRAVYEIRKTLAASGLRGTVAVGTYPGMGPGRASPIRIAFLGLKAKVESKCGQWPEDIASGSSLEGWKNESYWNFGCATQSVLAAQVDDPRDFVQARASDPPDVAMRMRAIGAVRRGGDPGTSWSVGLTPIGGGQ